MPVRSSSTTCPAQRCSQPHACASRSQREASLSKATTAQKPGMTPPLTLVRARKGRQSRLASAWPNAFEQISRQSGWCARHCGMPRRQPGTARSEPEQSPHNPEIRKDATPSHLFGPAGPTRSPGVSLAERPSGACAALFTAPRAGIAWRPTAFIGHPRTASNGCGGLPAKACRPGACSRNSSIGLTRRSARLPY